VQSFPYHDLYKRLFVVEDGCWAIDVRHALMLYNFVRRCQFGSVLEVGCHHGMSTTALVQAVSDNAIQTLWLCDLHFKDAIYHLTEPWTKKGRIKLLEMEATRALRQIETLDFVFLDGDHTAPATLTEVELIARLGVDHLALHDTMTYSRPGSASQPWFDGPALVARRLEASPTWHCVQDAGVRIGEQTDRGFMVASRDHIAGKIASEVFNFWGKVPREVLFPIDQYDTNSVPLQAMPPAGACGCSQHSARRTRRRATGADGPGAAP
jgi:hypothetical protein